MPLAFCLLFFLFGSLVFIACVSASSGLSLSFLSSPAQIIGTASLTNFQIAINNNGQPYLQSITITLTPSQGSFTSASTTYIVTTSSGIASFNSLSLSAFAVSNSTMLSASAHVSSSAYNYTATSPPFAFNQAVKTIQIQGPASVQANTAVTFTVTLFDQFSDVFIPSPPVLVSLSLSSGVFSVGLSSLSLLSSQSSPQTLFTNVIIAQPMQSATLTVNASHLSTSTSRSTSTSTLTTVASAKLTFPVLAVVIRPDLLAFFPPAALQQLDSSSCSTPGSCQALSPYLGVISLRIYDQFGFPFSSSSSYAFSLSVSPSPGSPPISLISPSSTYTNVYSTGSIVTFHNMTLSPSTATTGANVMITVQSTDVRLQPAISSSLTITYVTPSPSQAPSQVCLHAAFNNWVNIPMTAISSTTWQLKSLTSAMLNQNPSGANAYQWGILVGAPPGSWYAFSASINPVQPYSQYSSGVLTSQSAPGGTKNCFFAPLTSGLSYTLQFDTASLAYDWIVESNQTAILPLTPPNAPSQIPTSLLFATQPQQSLASVASSNSFSPFSVLVLDQNGALFTSRSLTVNISLPSYITSLGGTLSGTLTSTSSLGIAWFRSVVFDENVLVAGVENGGASLLASSNGLFQATSAPAILYPVVVSISISNAVGASGGASSVFAGQSWQPPVYVTANSQFAGLPYTQIYPLSFSLTFSGNLVLPSGLTNISTCTSSQGTNSFPPFNISVPGSYTYTVTSINSFPLSVQSVTSSEFTVLPPSPSSVLLNPSSISFANTYTGPDGSVSFIPFNVLFILSNGYLSSSSNSPTSISCLQPFCSFPISQQSIISSLPVVQGIATVPALTVIPSAGVQPSSYFIQFTVPGTTQMAGPPPQQLPTNATYATTVFAVNFHAACFNWVDIPLTYQGQNVWNVTGLSAQMLSNAYQGSQYQWGFSVITGSSSLWYALPLSASLVPSSLSGTLVTGSGLTKNVEFQPSTSSSSVYYSLSFNTLTLTYTFQSSTAPGVSLFIDNDSMSSALIGGVSAIGVVVLLVIIIALCCVVKRARANAYSASHTAVARRVIIEQDNENDAYVVNENKNANGVENKQMHNHGNDYDNDDRSELPMVSMPNTRPPQPAPAQALKPKKLGKGVKKVTSPTDDNAMPNPLNV